jgi:hypothetical protein
MSSVGQKQSGAAEPPSGVVLDAELSRAFLYAAYHEGLLPGDDLVGDGFPRTRLANTPRKHVIASAFEQLIVGGRIFMPSWVPREWHETLRDMCAEPIDRADDDPIEVVGLSPEVILGMMEARGVVWSLKEFEDKVGRYLEAAKALDSVANGQSFEGLAIRESLASIGWLNIDLPYSGKQLAAWEQLQVAHASVRPVDQSVSEYRTVVTAALRLRALSAIPVRDTGRQLAPQVLTDSAQQVQLLRMSCEQLQRLPVPTSLKQTLHVARSPEAAAMRSKLAAWSQQLAAGNVEAATLVLSDAADASRQLQMAQSFSRGGQLVTWIGLPVSVAGLVIAAPALAAAGVAVSVGGGIALGSQKVLEHFGRWAMYGNG